MHGAAARMSSPSPKQDLVLSETRRSAPSPTEVKLNAERERKLQERFGPSSMFTVGFGASQQTVLVSQQQSGASRSSADSDNQAQQMQGSSLSSPAIEDSQKESSSKSMIEPESTSKRYSLGAIPSGSSGRNARLDDFFSTKRNLKRSKSEETENGGNVSSNPIVNSPHMNDGDEETLRVNSSMNNDDLDEGDEDDGMGTGIGDNSPALNKSGKRMRFTQEEDECLLALYAKHGSDWKVIAQNAGSTLGKRSQNALARRFATLSKRQNGTATGPATSQQASVSPVNGNDGDDDEVQIVDGPQTPANQPQILQFFKPANGSAISNSTAATSGPSIQSVSSSTKRVSNNVKGDSSSKESIAELKQFLGQYVEDIQRLNLELEKTKREKHEAETELQNNEKHYKEELEEHKQRLGRAREVLIQVLRQQDKAEAARIRKHCSEMSFGLGRFATARPGSNHQLREAREVWEDGQMKKDLQMRMDQILQQKTELEKQTKQWRANRQQRRTASASPLSQLELELEERALEEVRAIKLAKVKQEELQLAEDRAKWQIEKQLHIRELRRIRDEDASKYCERPVLENRYLLRSLLGKGGFSEVWKAFDLYEMRDVAIKIHELDPSWSEERRRNYSKHAKREYRIHLSVKHPRIVQLYDVIEINQSSCFATVLEYCPGTDLDFHLKKHKCLPEKEAKAILMQILSALLCLSTGGGVKDTTSIIHYDIKPANILFDSEGGVKLTDFGLSKIVSDEDSTVPGVELTSQGAGTYWYLPPECFNFDRTKPPIISNKVDVWSTGVVFYQMLFGQRPFGEGLSQDHMLKSETVLKATRVDFPAKPVVSESAKDFIRRCLTYSQELRPTVEKLCEDPYLRPPKKKAPSSALPSSSSMPPPPFNASSSVPSSSANGSALRSFSSAE